MKILIVVLSFFSLHAFAREAFQFGANKEINVISDKAYRISSQDRFQAIGNVIIIHADNSIYGEKADLNFSSGEVTVEGNVRYVGSGLTIYGSKLFYHMKDKTMNIDNARLISPDYTIVGKTLAKVGEGEFEGKEAEYSTCKDCPESWSIYGKRINITQNEYIRIHHGFLKVKGVVALYFPYLLFPIKKDRESGLLFPRMGFNFADGVRFQQPYFHVIDDSSDLTLTPSIWGKRGIGGEFEFRKFFSEENWVQVDGLISNDRVYEPFKEELTLAEDKTFRQFSNWEHHYSKGLWFNHHLNFTEPSDLDLLRDFDFYTLNKIQGSEIGGEGFFDFRFPLFSASIYSGQYQNLLYNKPKEFDDRYVQIQPEVNISTTPYRLFFSKSFPVQSVFLGYKSTWSNFKQNNIEEDIYFRNASRLNLQPKAVINFQSLGPLNLFSEVSYDYQKYKFRNGADDFKKSTIQYETTAFLEVDKIFGYAYQTNVNKKYIKQEELGEKKLNNKNDQFVARKELVGKLDRFKLDEVEQDIKITSNSYRHRQRYAVKHYLLSDIREEGNDEFLSQIQNVDGQFDRIDTLRQLEFQNNQGVDVSLPFTNTIELKWENSLIEKSSRKESKDNKRERSQKSYLIDDFNYREIGYFNVSQAYDFDYEGDGGSDEFVESLSRLLIETGVTGSMFSFSTREYYFHNAEKHRFNMNLGLRTSILNLSLTYDYNTLGDPIRKIIGGGGSLNIFDLYLLSTRYEYDINFKIPRSSYGVTYSPLNDCWKLNLNYTQNLIEKRVSFNFLIKFNEKGFSSLSGAN